MTRIERAYPRLAAPASFRACNGVDVSIAQQSLKLLPGKIRQRQPLCLDSKHTANQGMSDNE